MRFAILGAICAVALFAWSGGSGSSLPFVSWASALEKSPTSAKPIMIYYGGDW